MSEFHDPDLRQQLGRLSGPYPDENAAFAAWQKRVGQARRRRAMGVTTGAAMSLIVAVVAVAALQHPSSPRVGEHKGTTTELTLATQPPTSDDDSSTTESTSPESVVETTEPSYDSQSPVTAPTEPPMVDTGTHPADTQAVAPPPSTKTTTGTTKPTTHTQAPTTTETVTVTDPQSVTQTIESPGGSITVRWDGEKLKIVDDHESDGYEKHEQDSTRTKVGVTFTSESHRWVVTAWVYKGVIYNDVHETDPHSHQDSFPWGGGGGGGDGGTGGTGGTTQPDGDHSG